ncbi:hypothetical protein EDF34_0543 [Cellulomonas sp. PhB150]|nr:hypothetical protein EDF34_0543 [Cellulomonas sp. PhB150]
MSEGAVSVRRMIIDCESCTARPVACGDCVVTFLTIGSPRAAVGASDGVDLDVAEQHAIGVLAASGLVPPLRMDPAV